MHLRTGDLIVRRLQTEQLCLLPLRPAQHGFKDQLPIILAELAAYFFAWQVFEAKHGVMTRERLGRPYNVAVLTDNQPITQQAARAMGGAYVRGDSGPIWAGLVAGLKQIGSSMSFHFIPRMSIELNWAADKLCGQAREALCAEEVGTVTKRRVVVDVNKLNPA